MSYKINPATVLKGVTLLTEAGVLYKKRGVGMFVSKGAAKQVLQKRRRLFYDGYVVRLLEEAQKLGIGKRELITMIDSEGKTNE